MKCIICKSKNDVKKVVIAETFVGWLLRKRKPFCKECRELIISELWKRKIENW